MSMYEFLEEIKENAEVSKRELLLGIIVGFLSGVVVGMLASERAHKPRSPKQIIIEKPSGNDGIILNREDYD